MSAAHIHVHQDGHMGMQIHSHASVVCTRHALSVDSFAGLWAVMFIPEGIAREVMGYLPIFRPAVVDDFGSLVFVGPAQ